MPSRLPTICAHDCDSRKEDMEKQRKYKGGLGAIESRHMDIYTEESFTSGMLYLDAALAGSWSDFSS